MRLRTPSRDDASLVVFPVAVNHRNLQAIHQSDGIHALLAVCESVINSFDRRPLENPRRVFERKPMQRKVPAILFLVPTVPHNAYLHNVNTRAESLISHVSREAG